MSNRLMITGGYLSGCMSTYTVPPRLGRTTANTSERSHSPITMLKATSHEPRDIPPTYAPEGGVYCINSYVNLVQFGVGTSSSVVSPKVPSLIFDRSDL